MARYCPNCGAKQDETSKFCMNCGTPLEPEKKDDGKVIITRRTLDKYFSKNVTTEKRQEVILDLLDRWKRGQQKT